MLVLDKFYDIILINPYLNQEGRIFEEIVHNKYINVNGIELHNYGIGPFCRFSIPRKYNLEGVYVFFINNEIKHIGQTVNLSKRINQGYGKISPRNCFVRGQSTNCRINTLILNEFKLGNEVLIKFYQTQNHVELERQLITMYRPVWNIKSDNSIYKIHQKDRKLQNKRVSVTKNPSVAEVRDYIRRKIERKFEAGLSEITIISGNIHKELSIVNDYPTVCSAMQSLGPNYYYKGIYAPPKGNGATLEHKYYKKI